MSQTDLTEESHLLESAANVILPTEVDSYPDTVASEADSEELSDPDGFVRTNQRVFYLLIEALFALILRLWLATISVSLLMYFLRRNPIHTLVHQSGALMSDSEVDISIYPSSLTLTHYTAIPALFGEILKTTKKGPLIHIRESSCTDLKVEFPVINMASISMMSAADQKETISKNKTKTLNWIALIERGGCPFDQKIFYLQKAGFSSAIVYNHFRENKDYAVRMSDHSLGKDISIFASFISRNTANAFLKEINNQNGNTIFASIEKRIVEWHLTQTLLNGFVDMAVLFFLVVITGSGFFMFGIFLNLGHNLFVHGQMYAVETIHEASLIILAVSSQIPTQPKLKTVDFPLRNLDENSLLSDWRNGGVKGQESCPICIDDFQIGDNVRELPCQHIFHDTCVDPWLIKHNRLCPVCKRDVLSKKKTFKVLKTARINTIEPE